jgi:hypothetical protein
MSGAALAAPLTREEAVAEIPVRQNLRLRRSANADALPSVTGLTRVPPRGTTDPTRSDQGSRVARP